MDESDLFVIDLRLREYDTLRQEILMRSQTRYQLVAAVFAAGALSASLLKDSSPTASLIVAVGSIFALSAIWWWLGIAVARCAGVLAELERRINECAAKGNLLTWEQRQAKWRNDLRWYKRFYKRELPEL